jgi:hypothetical protein
MTQASAQTSINGSRLVRLLSQLAVSDVEVSHKHFAQRLGQLIDLSDSVTLASAHGEIAAMSFEPTEASCEAIAEEFLRVRTALVQSLVKSFVTDANDARIRFPVHQSDGAPDDAKAYERYRNFYSAQQRDIDGKIQRLQNDVRDAASGVSAQLAQLAALDRVVGDTLALHSRKFFAAIPKLLARRYHYLIEQYYQPVSGTEQGPRASLEIHQRLSREMQGLLLTEIEVRLLPVLGIIEALNAEADKNTYE